MLPSRFSHVQLCVTPQTAAHQALPSLGFSRQELDCHQCGQWGQRDYSYETIVIVHLIVKRPALEFFVIMSLLIWYLTEYRGAARYKKHIRKYVSLPCKNADSTREGRQRCTYKHHELLGMSSVYSVFKIFVCVSCSVVSDSWDSMDYVACEAPLPMGFPRQE